MKQWIRRSVAVGTGTGLMVLISAVAGAQDSTSVQPQRKLEMVQARAELSRTLDAKKARQGQPVLAKLEQKVQIPNEEALPKNTVLEGHVDQVQPSEHRSDSTVVVTFDKAKLKGGQVLPIKATILAVSEPALLRQQEAQTGGPSAMPSAPAAGGMGPQAAGGGASAGMASSPQSPPMQPMGTTGGPANQQTQKNGVPGVTLKSDIHQPTSATFQSKGRNVHIPDGTQLDIALAVIPSGVHLQQ